MNTRIITIAAAAIALAATGSAQAQLPGAGIKIGGDATIKVQQDKAVTTVAVGQRVKAHTWTGSILGNVDIGGSAKIDVRQKGAVTTVAVGKDAEASTVTGTISSFSPR